jgi:hypothetical protein
MSATRDLIATHAAVVAAARAASLPDDLADLPAQAQARLAALAAASGGGAPRVPRAPSGSLDEALERALAAAYAAVQRIDDEKTLRVVARVMAGDGQSLALLRRSMNRKPVPSAFETGKAP